MKVLGEIPKNIQTISVDIDATVYKGENPFLQERTKKEYEWIAEKFNLAPNQVPQFVNDRKKGFLKAAGRQRRISLSEIIFSLGIKSEEWNTFRESSLPNPGEYLKFDPALQKAVVAISRKIRIIWNTNSSEKIGRKILETVLGMPVEKFVVIGQKNELFKPSKEFVEFLIVPEILAKGGLLDKTISIGDRADDDGTFPIQAGIKGAIIITGPDELVVALKKLERNKGDKIWQRQR